MEINKQESGLSLLAPESWIHIQKNRNMVFEGSFCDPDTFAIFNKPHHGYKKK